MLDREVARIAQADELLGWIMSQHKSRECNRGRNRFEGARRNGDDQAFDRAPSDLLENVGHGVNMPVEMKLFTRHHGLQRSCGQSLRNRAEAARRGAPVGLRDSGFLFWTWAIGAISNAASLYLATR